MPPTPYTVVDGFTDVHECQPLIDITWDEALSCIAAESRWIERASEAADSARFDKILEGAPDVESGDDGDWLFRSVEVGAAGLVFALSAAGFATCTSCRGHAGLHGQRRPLVGFNTDPHRLRTLAKCGARAGCGLKVRDRLALAVGRSVADLHSMAQGVFGERAIFDALPPPPWQSRALEALEDDDEIE
jgi:hypothetical protein